MGRGRSLWTNSMVLDWAEVKAKGPMGRAGWRVLEGRRPWANDGYVVRVRVYDARVPAAEALPMPVYWDVFDEDMAHDTDRSLISGTAADVDEARRSAEVAVYYLRDQSTFV